jgi:hypothetical protein
MIVLDEDRHRRAEAREGLRHLGANGTPADHRQPPRLLGQLEERFVGQIAGLDQAGQWQGARPAAGGDQRLGEAQRLPLHSIEDLDRVGAGEMGLPQEDLDPLALQAGHRVIVADVGAQAAHPRHDRAEIHLDAFRHADPQLGRPAQLADHLRRANDALGGHAAPVQAVAAQQMALDQRGLAAQAGRPDGADQPRGPPADDDQVVAAVGPRIAPVGRVRVGHQPAVVLVHGRYDHRLVDGISHIVG